MEDIDAVNLKAYAAMLDKFEDVEERPFYVMILKLIDEYLPRLKGKSVLDIGSGPGALALLLKNRGLDVTCLDPSEPMLERCREKGLKVVHSRMQDYSPDCKFKLVLALSSLLHIRKSEFPGQLRKIAAMQDSDDYFVLTMAQGESEGITDQGLLSERFFAMYTKEEILKIAKPYYKLLYFNDDYVSKVNRRFMIFGLQRL